MSATSDETLADEPVTLAAAAETLGVHYMTAYRYVRTGRMMAEKRAGQWWVHPADLAAVLAEGTGARRRPSGSGEARASLVEPFTARLIAGDTAGCWDLVTDALSGGASPAEVHQNLLGVALEHVGEGWHRGDLSVADEHRATATAYRLIGQMGPLFRHRGRRRGTVILGTVSGDPHALPTAMMADFLSDRRFEVVDLGAHTPTESFLSVAGEVDDLVGIGVCVVLDECVKQAVVQVTALRTALPAAFLLAGGPAIERSDLSPRDLPVDVVTGSVSEVCDAFEAAAARRIQPEPSASA